MNDNGKQLLGYLGGDIMSFGSNLAREYEYESFKKANIPGEVYSPVMNKSINDKSNMTEEENNHLAEKICEADIERLWNSDYTVLCPEQSAIGTMCEMGVLYGWKYFIEHFINDAKDNAVAKKLLTVLDDAESFRKTVMDTIIVCRERIAAEQKIKLKESNINI